jgi:hypothetical protein
MVGLLGIIAVTGRWPVDAPRTHAETGGILSLPPDRIVRVELSVGEQRSLFTRDPREGWLFNGGLTGPAVASHIDTAARLLTVSAPRRVIAAGEYGSGKLAEYGLDPPIFVLSVAESGDSTTRLGFGEATPAQNAQYVRILDRPELYLLPRDVGEEWRLARDMAERAGSLLLPVSIAQVWAIEILSRGTLYRFERDPAGLWFHHAGQHEHAPGGLVHHADPTLAPLIEAELAVLDRLPIARVVAGRPDAAALASSGLEHPATILLLYARDSAGPVARVELGKSTAEGPDCYARIQLSGTVVIVPDDVVRHLATLLDLAGTSS